MSAKSEVFSSRWGMMLAMLGMAVGTGNIWRFPRIAASNGGGSFLVAWVVFLLIWSVPLILVEFAVGRKTRLGTVGAFVKMLGPNWAWMGAWIALVATAIMFYYSVVAGWTLRYTWAALSGELSGAALAPGTFWQSYTTSWVPALTHLLAMGVGAWVVYNGVKGIERVAKIVMPLLFFLVIALAIRAVTLPGAIDGLNFLFTPHWHDLADSNTWLQALTQNAWDTGAGWGLILTYACYVRPREDTTLNAFMLGFGNNSISLLAGVMVLCTVFAVVPSLVAGFAANPQALAAYPQLAAAVQHGQAVTPALVEQTILKSNNEGLTFIWIPQLFARLPAGRMLMILFFLSLFFAAWTSLISMIELASRVLMDAGLTRGRAIALVGTVGFLLGLPSALSLDVLHNQDWVWGVGLMVSGLFFTIGVIKVGVTKFRTEWVNHPDADIQIGRWWDIVIGWLVPLQAVVLIVWWLYQAWGGGAEGWLNPLGTENVGTVLAQWAVALVVLLLANRWLARRSGAGRDDLGPPPASIP